MLAGVTDVPDHEYPAVQNFLASQGIAFLGTVDTVSTISCRLDDCGCGRVSRELREDVHTSEKRYSRCAGRG
jgi:hypothetical protein